MRENNTTGVKWQRRRCLQKRKKKIKNIYFFSISNFLYISCLIISFFLSTFSTYVLYMRTLSAPAVSNFGLGQIFFVPSPLLSLPLMYPSRRPLPADDRKPQRMQPGSLVYGPKPSVRSEARNCYRKRN